jgi:hypothetical protein
MRDGRHSRPITGNAPASGLAASAAARSSARSPRCGPSGRSTTSTSPTPIRRSRRQAGPSTIPRPSSRGSITPRRSQPPTVPWTWWAVAASGTAGTVLVGIVLIVLSGGIYGLSRRRPVTASNVNDAPPPQRPVAVALPAAA